MEMSDGPMSESEKRLNAKEDDEFVFDELGNLYLLDDVLTNLLLSFKRVTA